MKLIIDKRMRLREKQYLQRFGDIIELPPQNSVYEEISGHPDIFFTKINGKLYKAKNLQFEHRDLENIPEGEEVVGYSYPGDVKYNICQIGKNVIHDFRYTDKKLLECIKEEKLNQIQVGQGYSKCNIAVTSDDSCITSDKGIYDLIHLLQKDTLLLNNETINLLDKNGNKTKMNGFIGGASCIIYDKFILFGDSDKLKHKEDLEKHLKKCGLDLIDFKGLEINDYGGVITF